MMKYKIQTNCGLKKRNYKHKTNSGIRKRK